MLDIRKRLASIVDKINLRIYVVASIIVLSVLFFVYLPSSTVHMVFRGTLILSMANALIAAPLVINLKLHDRERRVFIRRLIVGAFALVIFSLYSRSLLRLIGLSVPWGSGWEYFIFYLFTLPAVIILLLAIIYRAISRANGKISSFITSMLSIYLLGFSCFFIFEAIYEAVFM